MEINDSLIDKLEELSKLKLEVKERELIKRDLSNILKMIDKIQEVDTADVLPLQYINLEEHELREDLAENELSNSAALKNAPMAEGNYFSVPKVIDL